MFYTGNRDTGDTLFIGNREDISHRGKHSSKGAEGMKGSCTENRGNTGDSLYIGNTGGAGEMLYTGNRDTGDTVSIVNKGDTG